MRAKSNKQVTYIHMDLYFDLPAGVHPEPGTRKFEQLLSTIRSEIIRFGDHLAERHKWNGYGHAFTVRRAGSYTTAWTEQQDNPDSPEWKR